MIYNEIKIYINDLTLSRATMQGENELCIYIDTPNLIVSMLYYYREKL